jgi:hypothetical protein
MHHLTYKQLKALNTSTMYDVEGLAALEYSSTRRRQRTTTPAAPEVMLDESERGKHVERQQSH